MIKQTIESPLSNGKAVLQEEEATLTYRGEEYRYMHRNYRDLETGLEFTNTELDEENLERIYVQYRKVHDIPSPKELTEMRERYGLSAIKMAEVLGLGANQYAKYEQGEMPSESVGKMLRSIQTPAVFMGYIDGAKKKFSPEEYAKICAKVQKSFVKIIKSKPDLSWFWDFFAPSGFARRVAL